MASTTLKKRINPPNTSNMTKVLTPTSEVATSYTSQGGWYCAKAINAGGSAQEAYAYLLDSNNAYLATVTAPANAYTRCVTPFIYFPKGVSFQVRIKYLDSTQSGLFFASQL